MSLPVVACFDPGFAHLGWALVEGRQVLAFGVLETSPRQPIGERLDAVAEQARTVIVDPRVSLVAAEEQWRAQVGKLRQGKTTHNALWQAQVVGILRGVAHVRGQRFLLVDPQRVKRAVGCSSSADKDAVQRAVKATCTGELPTLKKHTHAADAIAVGVAAGMVARATQLRIGEVRTRCS